MAIIFNVLPPDEATVNVDNLMVGSFFRPVGNTGMIHLKIGAMDESGAIPVMTIYPGKYRAVGEFVRVEDEFVLVEDITMSFQAIKSPRIPGFPAFVVKER